MKSDSHSAFAPDVNETLSASDLHVMVSSHQTQIGHLVRVNYIQVNEKTRIDYTNWAASSYNLVSCKKCTLLILYIYLLRLAS